MNIYDEIQSSFKESLKNSPVNSTFILMNPSILEIPSKIDLLASVPMYMLWCTQHPNQSSSIFDHTIWALAEYGRCKDEKNAYLNFRFQCNQHQIKTVISFLEWGRTIHKFLDRNQINRAITNWQNAFNSSKEPYQENNV